MRTFLNDLVGILNNEGGSSAKLIEKHYFLKAQALASKLGGHEPVFFYVRF